MTERPGRATLRSGDRVVCLGNSITADPDGYVTMARDVLRLSGPGIEVINAGAAGNTAANLAERFERDALSREPSWVTISAGGNDAIGSVSVADYARAMSDMIEAAQRAGVRVGLCTPTPVEPLLSGADVELLNERIEEYAAWIGATCEERNLLVIPMFETFELVHQSSEPGDEVWLTHDGVHMSPTGRYLMGLTFLAAFGVSLEPGPDEATPSR